MPRYRFPTFKLPSYSDLMHRQIPTITSSDTPNSVRCENDYHHRLIKVYEGQEPHLSVGIRLHHSHHGSVSIQTDDNCYYWRQVGMYMTHATFDQQFDLWLNRLNTRRIPRVRLYDFRNHKVSNHVYGESRYTSGDMGIWFKFGCPVFTEHNYLCFCLLSAAYKTTENHFDEHFAGIPPFEGTPEHPSGYVFGPPEPSTGFVLLEPYVHITPKMREWIDEMYPVPVVSDGTTTVTTTVTTQLAEAPF